MNETQKRIKAYKDALPGLRERVAAVALLLAMSVAMMTSATFAWLTISRAPEVSGVNTTVAANGNLEIALVNEAGTQPGESKVGDSSAADGQSVAAANLTWGNLVNLSDPSYGLEYLVLRPAQLNTASLLDNPLYGAVYGKDGRITQLNSNFGYTTWNMPDGLLDGHFGVSDKYGVRAISSTKVSADGAIAKYLYLLQDAEAKNLAAGMHYNSLTQDEGYMNSLATMMGLFMTANMNPSEADLSNPTCEVEDIENLRDMYGSFLDAFYLEAGAIAALADVQLFLKNSKNEGFDYTSFTSHYTPEMIYASTTASLAAQGIKITQLNEFIRDWNIVKEDYEKLKTLASQGGTIKWKDTGLSTIVSRLANVNTCTLDGTPIGSIGASNAMGYLDGETHEAVITNGILYNFEYRCGVHIRVRDLPISATVRREVPILGVQTVPATVKANITTSAPLDQYLFLNDVNYTKTQNTGFVGGETVAEDTYGLAVDLWVRTNAESSYLTLEGNVISETTQVRATGKDANGNTVDLYTVTMTEEVTTEETDPETNETTTKTETVTYNVDLYQIVTTTTDDSGAETETVTWYSADNHSVITEENLDGAVPIAKMVDIVTVIGYEGENRVWQDNSLLTVDSTTQGSGSCYVYYADTPEDQARSLKLLEAFNVAFVDGDGKLMAVAEMDTDHAYKTSGRVIVPLVLRGDSISLGEDAGGNEILAITPLEKNTPTRITAIIYLDGALLTNDEVLAAADIRGQLNIQFGSSIDMNAMTNEKLETAERSVAASVNVDKFDYDTATAPMTTTVTVNVSGEDPSTMTAFFLRQINSTQGSREEAMTFTKSSEGVWVADYTFTAPGKYVLRTVRLDGQDYDLETCPEVEISGFAIRSLSCQQATNNNIRIMTAANFSTVNVSLQFATNDVTKMPKTVLGRFINEDDAVSSINFAYNANTGTWNGTATFLTSGNYTLQYLVLDGRYTELAESLWQTASVTLGMKVAVYTTSPQNFTYRGNDMADNEKLLGMRVKIMDNTGTEMPGITGVKLVYNMKGSAIRTMDTNLTWDGSNYYTGSMQTTMPGVFEFGYVSVADNTITNATTSPTFTILSPEPPAFYQNLTEIYQYRPDKNAAMTVLLTNTMSASVRATIVDDSGNEYTENGTLGTNDFTAGDGTVANYWNFKVPAPASVGGYQDGEWQMTKLELWDVYDDKGNLYTEDEPMVIDVSGEGIVTKVVNRFEVSFAEDKSQNFNGSFMQAHTVSGLNMDIRDLDGEPLNIDITDVKMTFTNTLNADTMKKYGGYTTTDVTNATEGITRTVDFSGSAGSTRYTQTADTTLIYAGEYTTEISFKVAGVSYTLSGDTLPIRTPKFTVASTSPTVLISDISLDGSGAYSVDKFTTGTSITDRVEKEVVDSGCFDDYYYTCFTHADHVYKANNTAYISKLLDASGNVVTKDGVTAHLYFKCSHDDVDEYDGGKSTNGFDRGAELDYHEYAYDNGNGVPKATLRISGMGEASGASLEFAKTGGGNVAMITEYTYDGGSSGTYWGNYNTYGTSSYEWTNSDSNGDGKLDGTASCTRFIGYMDNGNGTDGNDTKTAAGEIKASNLVLTYSGMSFSFTVSTITINNPF